MKILIVDDSKLARHQLYSMLKELGYSSIAACEDARTAKAILASNEIHLILSDYNMPGETGLDLVRWIRATPAIAKIPIIMITTVSERDKVIEAVKCGIQNYLFKPVQRKVLAEKIADLARAYGFSTPEGAGKSAAASSPVARGA